MKKAKLEDYTKSVPAKTTQTFNYGGETILFYAVSATGLQVRLDSGNLIPVLAGLRLQLPTADKFNKLTFFNSTGAAISVSFYVAASIDLQLTKVS